MHIHTPSFWRVGFPGKQTLELEIRSTSRWFRGALPGAVFVRKRGGRTRTGRSCCPYNKHLSPSDKEPGAGMALRVIPHWGVEPGFCPPYWPHTAKDTAQTEAQWRAVSCQRSRQLWKGCLGLQRGSWWHSIAPTSGSYIWQFHNKNVKGNMPI